jgi:methionine-rich copper-binding protein CopC
MICHIGKRRYGGDGSVFFCLAVLVALPARSLAHAYIVAATPAANEK